MTYLLPSYESKALSTWHSEEHPEYGLFAFVMCLAEPTYYTLRCSHGILFTVINGVVSNSQGIDIGKFSDLSGKIVFMDAETCAKAKSVWSRYYALPLKSDFNEKIRPDVEAFFKMLYPV